MKLIELNPRFGSDNEGRRFLTFDCPIFTSQRISIQVKGKGRVVWDIDSEDFETMTVSPSIEADCPPLYHWHGWIRKGEIINA